ncbi:MAG TPA: PAS domain S-box protein, partial [Chryseolinea sp.]
VANDAALAVWQVGREVIGKKLVEIVPEMARQPFLELMQDVYRNGVTRYGYQAPAFFIRKDGVTDERFFNFIYVPYVGVNEAIVGVLILATDVTEQVVAQKQLIDNEERLRIANEILELGTWEYDPAMDAIKCSQKSIELFGFPNHQSVNITNVLGSINEEDRPRIIAAIQAALNPNSQGKFDVEYAMTTVTDSTEKVLRANGQVFFDGSGKPYRIIGTVVDITDRKKAEVEIKASEARFRLLATSIPQIVWTYDREGNTTYISEQFEKFTGQELHRSNKSWHNLIHPDDRGKIASREQHSIESGEGWEDEFRLQNIITGHYRWFLGNLKPLKDGNDNIIMWIGSASDVQNLKEQSNWLEHQIQERTRALKELNQSLKISNEDLQQFAHVASHDLKEPIRKIKTFSNRLHDDYKDILPEKANNFLTKIRSATDRMYSMIDGVLSYSTTAAISQPTQNLDLNEVISQIQTDLEVPIFEKKATLVSEVLPSVDGAPVLLYQLFYNLINNSLKFSKKEEAPIITIKSQMVSMEGKPFVKIVVGDNGIGFNPEDAERIFTTFTRLNSKDNYEGTGLGLALCKKIAQRHSGFIYAHGEKNVGAQFTVLLPI